jgi:hypothetical protein
MLLPRLPRQRAAACRCRQAGVLRGLLAAALRNTTHHVDTRAAPAQQLHLRPHHN